MLRTLTLGLVTCGLLAFGGCGIAVADEIYICDGNKAVRVKLSDLEHMKRTNACVAAHYGLTIKVKTPEPATPSKPSQRPESKSKAGRTSPAPVLGKPAPQKALPSESKADAHIAAPLSAKAATPTPALEPAPKTAAPAIELPVKGLPIEEVSADPSDYRNVRVINASSEPAKWYRHNR